MWIKLVAKMSQYPTEEEEFEMLYGEEMAMMDEMQG